MNLKNQKGFAGADITAAILILTIFAGIIASLYANYSSTSREIKIKSEAVNQAIATIEEIKSKSQEYFNEENATKREIKVYDNEQIGNTPYSRTVVIQVKVNINYKSNKKTQTMELSTVIRKEKEV